MDLIGLNFYAPMRIKGLDFVPDFSTDIVMPNTHFFNSYAMPYARMNTYRG
jgi:hypothetical protein